MKHSATHETNPPRTGSNPWIALSLLGALGTTVATCIVAGVLLGRFLQTRLGAGAGVMALCVLGGVFAGLLGGATMLLRVGAWKRHDGSE